MFESFAAEILGSQPPIPFSASTISLYVAYLFQKSFAPSTISTYLSAIGYVHKMLALPDNTQSFLVDKLVVGAYRLGHKIDIRLPITIPVLNNLVRAIPAVLASSYEQCLFRAMYLFAFSAFARIGELVTVYNVPLDNVLKLSDITIKYVGKQIQEVQVAFRQFKHNVKQGPQLISFSHGEAAFSSVQSIYAYLQNSP